MEDLWMSWFFQINPLNWFTNCTEWLLYILDWSDLFCSWVNNDLVKTGISLSLNVSMTDSMKSKLLFKGALRDFDKPAQSPTGPCPYFNISTPHVHIDPWQWWTRKQVKMTHKHIQTKVNMDNLWKTNQNQCYSPIKKKQCNLGVRFHAFPLLVFSPPLENCSDIYTGPTSESESD